MYLNCCESCSEALDALKGLSIKGKWLLQKLQYFLRCRNILMYHVKMAITNLQGTVEWPFESKGTTKIFNQQFI